MADDFLIPEAFRKRYQQLINAGGDGSDMDVAIDMMGDDVPSLTELQREKLYKEAGPNTRKHIDHHQGRIDKKRAKGVPADNKAIKRINRLTDRWLVSEHLGKKWYASPERKKYMDNKGWEKRIDPKNVFEDKRGRKGAITAMGDMAQQLRQGTMDSLQTNVTDAASGPVADMGEFQKNKEVLQTRTANNATLDAQRAAVDVEDAKDAAKQAQLTKQKSLADRIRKSGLSVVKKGAPKLAALMGGPLGWGIAGASTLMDAKDAYAMGESTMNPQNEEERMRQHYLAELMRRNEVP
jgi:hypothetical protein